MKSESSLSTTLTKQKSLHKEALNLINCKGKLITFASIFLTQSP